MTRENMKERLLKAIRRVMPEDRLLITIFAFMFNNTIYYLSRLIAGGWEHHILSGELEKMIPLIPESVVIYFGCYLFWSVNYIMIAKLEKEWAYRFFFADFISRIICLGFFFCIRRQISDRNLTEQVSGTKL